MDRLVGRDAELAVGVAWLDNPTDLPSTIIIEGDPGAGKTALFGAVVALARERSYRVLEAAPAEPEAGLAYATLLDLIGPVAGEAMAALSSPQRSALEVALLLKPAEDVPPDRLAIGVACRGAIESLAAGAPLMVAIDDAQWIDEATSEALRFALRRIAGAPVAVLCARRTGMAAARRLGAGLPAPRTVALAPLSVGAIHAIIQAQTGITLDRPRLLRLHELSGGNPLYAIELARAYGSGSLRLAAGEPLPPDLESLVEHRIGALPTATVRLLATAAMTPAASLALLVEVHAGVDAAAALAPAVSAGVLLEPPEAGGTVAFAHPLLASAAIAALPTSQRRELQRALADAVTDVVERARHLAQSTTEPDAGVAAQLEAAAAEAIRRGAPSVAAELAAVARGVTPANDRTGADRRASAEAEYRFEAGDAAGASTILDELIARVPKGQPRARLLSHRARIAHFSDDVGAGVSLLREALEEAGDDRRLRGEIEEGLAWGLMLMRADLAKAVTHAASAARHAADVGDEALRAEALAAAALTRMVVGRPSTALMKEAVALEPATRGFRVLRHPSFALGYQLGCMDELDAARDVFGDLSARAAERGDESATASILGHLALIEALAGDLGAAETLATEAHELALESGQRPMRAAALGRIALARAMRGDAAAAREAASASLRLAGGDRFDPARPASALARGGEVALWSSGLLDVSLGSWSDAIRCLGPLSDHMLNAGVREPGELRFLIDEVEALVAMGEFDRASKRIDALDGIATRSRRPSARVTVAIGRGLHAAAMGDHEAAISILGASVPIAERLPLPILHGRTLLALGRVERRARRRAAARATLTAARDRFETIGAHGWAASAERELGRIGGRTSSGGELTSTEANVARLVATGKSNREVAAALFVTPKAIEASLARIYAKRGVRSRTELAHLLAEEASGKQ